MSKPLAILLGRSEAAVADAVNKLEALAGLPGEDLRLLSENRQTIRRKISQLGLDPDDTQAPELYHALRVRYSNDAQRLEKVLGVAADSDITTKIRKASMLVVQAFGRQEVWSLKASAIRGLLRQQPPRQLMKRLGYRSVDSLLKREAPEGILLMANLTESNAWLKQLQRTVAKYDTSKYAMQSYKVLALQLNQFSDLETDRPFVVDRLSGSIALWPATKSNGDTLSLAIQLASALRELGLKPNIESVLSAHPALAWWQGTEHLLYHHDGQVVSFNIEDMAVNYNRTNDYAESQQSFGQQSLWQELAQRYHQYSEAVAEIIPELETKLGQTSQAREPLMPLKLAAETVEV